MKAALARILRRAVPSASRPTYAWPVKLLLDAVDLPAGIVFPEFRSLPPNHMRVRVGSGSRLLANQVQFLNAASNFWLYVLGEGLCRLDHTIVDIGVGCGRYARHLRDYRYCGAEFSGTYIGIDIDQEMLDWCRRHFPAERFRFHRSTHGSTSYRRPRGTDGPYRIPEPDGTADFVFATSLFTHLLEPEMETYLQEAHRLLRPGGTLLVQFFALDLPPPTVGGRHSFRHRVGNARVESLSQPEAAVAYMSDFLLQRAAAAGFTCARVTTGPGTWQPALIGCKPVAPGATAADARLAGPGADTLTAERFGVA